MSFFELSLDPKYETYEQKIPIDGGGGMIRVCRTGPVSKPSSLGYNSSSNVVTFLITSDRDLKSYLRGFSFIMKGHAESSIGIFPHNGVNNTSVSIPWNSTCIIKNISASLDGKKDPYVEQYNNSLYPHAHTQRMLMELSRSIIEKSSDMFFTPTLEDQLETTTALSSQALARSSKWLSQLVTPPSPAPSYFNVIFHSKSLPLPMLLSWVANCDAFVSLKKIEIIFEFKSQDSVLFQLASNTSQNLYIIDSLELLYIEASSQLAQEQNQIIERVEGTHPQRIAYPYYDIMENQYVRNVSVQKNTCKNVQSMIISFSAPSVSSTYINPYQYVANGLTLINSKYGLNLVPNRPIELDSTNPLTSAELFYYMKLVQKKLPIQNFVPALDFYKNYGELHGSSAVNGNYNLYCVPFTTTDTLKRQQEGTIYINTTQSPSNSTDQIPVLLLAITGKFYQFNQDSTLIEVS
jgi:hypothetical protein